MRLITILVMYLFIISIPIIVSLSIVLTKSSNRKKFIQRYGYSPEVFKEVKKLKELLDCGIITQEEFDEKKKQLLNL